MDNRQNLLDCALNLFSQRGYDAVGVQEVVDAAGVTKPTLYHYFESKRGLLDALLAEEAGKLVDAVRHAAEYEHDLVAVLEKVARVYYGFAVANAAFYRLFLAMIFAPPESEAHGACQSFFYQQQMFIESVFMQAVADHGNLKGRHQRYAAGFLGALNALIVLHLNEGLGLTDEIVYQTVHQFMHGIFS
jgi:AcrR family transcriptional regulator